MNTAIAITLIIVGGLVLITSIVIVWLWSLTSRRGLLPPFQGGEDLTRRLDSVEKGLQELRGEVDKLKGHTG